MMDRLGYERVETDHGLFLLVRDGSFVFGLTVHVDDFLYGRTGAEVDLFDKELQESFSVGAIAIGNLTFTGLRMQCSEDSSSGQLPARVDQDHYLDFIEEIVLPPAREAMKEAAVTTLELTLYRRAVGALLWASGQTQPFMACTSSLLARRFHQAVVHDLFGVNRVIRVAKDAHVMPLRVQPVGTPHRLVVFTDASAISNASATAQMGYLIFLAKDTGTRGALTADTELALLAWGSHRQRRVTHSSFAAETYALLDGMRAAIEVACVLAHITHGVDTTLLPIDVFIDCQSLYNTMSATGVVSPKEVNAGVAALRGIYSGGTMSSLTWVPAAGQLEDCLTKQSPAGSLRNTLQTGRYGLRACGATTKTFETDWAELDELARDNTVETAEAVLQVARNEFAHASGTTVRWGSSAWPYSLASPSSPSQASLCIIVAVLIPR